MRATRTGETISPKEALLRAVPFLVAAGGMAHDLRPRVTTKSKLVLSIDDTVQSWVAARLLMEFEGASFYTPKVENPICEAFPCDQEFIWMLHPTDGNLYRNGGNQHEVRLLLCDRSHKILGAIVARPAFNEVLVAWGFTSDYRAFRVSTRSVEGPLKFDTPFEISGLRTPPPKIVMIPEPFQEQAGILKDAGFEVIIESSEAVPTCSSMNPVCGQISGVLSVHALIHGPGADGFLVQRAGGEWDHAPYAQDTKTFPWSIAAVDKHTAALLRAVVSAHGSLPPLSI